MKKIQLLFWLILTCLLLVHYFYVPEMPEIATGEISIDPNTSKHKSDLWVFWNTLVHEMGFDNRSVVLLQLSQYILEDRTAKNTHLLFIGEMNGERYLYEVYANYNGTISFKSQRFDYPLEGLHPLVLLREIDVIDFSTLSPIGGTITLQTLKHEVGRTYNITHDNISVLSDGSFHPLKEVSFPEGLCWYSIEITCVREPEAEQSQGDASSEILSDRIIAFVDHDIALATSVIYS